MESLINQAVDLLLNSSHTTAFTGAGISVESGIPPFRGKNGLWKEYDPQLFDINFFNENPEKSWELNKEIFYKVMRDAAPNRAHRVLARMETDGLLNAVITQNIDNLHQKAGSKNVYEFHGTSNRVVCLECGNKYTFTEEMLAHIPPRCDNCNGILKPDFIFFGEPIPEPAKTLSFKEADLADIFLLVGTTGEIQPASMIPELACNNGAKIIEVNTDKTNFTASITDVFLKGKATEVMGKLGNKLF